MRGFLATANHGSLSAGARALGLTQPTLSRQITALEAELGLMLFERVGRGLHLTQAGRDLLGHVRDMGAAADKVAVAAFGQSNSIEGHVRITASDIMSAFVLPRALSRLRSVAPGLSVEVVAANDIRDLMRREADIAVRHLRPEQPDLVARLIREAHGQLYASQSYIDTRGAPAGKDALRQHDFVSFGDTTQMIAYLKTIGIHLSPDNFCTGSGNGIVAWEMARAGLGIAPMDETIARQSPDMVQVLPDMDPIVFPVWLTTHREIHTSPRIRLVFDVLADHLARM